ncbi:MAG TPA: PAS domain S-box protein [Ktedonobacteraceae bacterium]|nr:PAS domain S-box protein [Ktedonobacteraceae bacterium]
MPGNLASPLLWKKNGASPDRSSLATWSAYTGQTEEVAQNWGWLNAVHPDDRENVRLTLNRAILTHTTYTFSCRIYHTPESYQPFKLLLNPRFDRYRQLQSWFVFFIDMSAASAEITEPWESLSMYNTMLRQNDTGVLCVSLDGSILRVNKRMCQLSGYTEQELLSQTLWQLGKPEYIDLQLQAMWRRLLNDEDPEPFRTRYQRKDGSPIWVRLIDFLMSLPSGEPAYFFFLVEDITEQIQAENERKDLLARMQEAHAEASAHALQLEAVFESITDGILVSNGEGQIVQSNPAVVHLLHLHSIPNFLHMSLKERFQHIQMFDEKGRKLKHIEWPLVRLLRGEKLEESGMTNDMREVLPDGEEIYVSHTGSTIRDQEDHIIGAVIVIRDVTERHRMEHNVRKSFGILLALAEELVHIPKQQPEPLTTKELESPWAAFQAAGEYLTVLTCQMMEYQAVTIVLLDPETEELFPIAIAGATPQERNLYLNLLQGSFLSQYLDASTIARLRNNKVAFNAFVRYAPDPHPYEMLVAPMIMNNKLVGVLGVRKKETHLEYNQEEEGLVKAVAKLILLVMERERLQKEWVESHSSELALREANKRFDEFLSIASHELRTPLAGIKGNVQLARRQLTKLKSNCLTDIDKWTEKLENIQEYLLHAEHRVNVQNRMISDLLDVSRIKAKKLELVMGLCDLVRIVSEAVEDQRYNAPGRIITMTQPVEEKIMVTGDADRLSQVIHNYLTNALKYSSTERPVEVKLDLEKNHNLVRVSVQDEGPGLSYEEQKHVWERFYRVKGIMTQGNTGPGLGLGLHICRTIIEAHKGYLGLESTPGVGSTFWFALPLAQTAPDISQHSLSDQLQRTNETLEQKRR